MSSHRCCDTCRRHVDPGVNTCPECGGDIRVTITEPGQGLIEYVIRHPNYPTQKVNDHA
jgi:RNA polymerase subunit RPABC4/transcription elongation factor Spt4